jgi:hypothetical protein
VTVVFSSARLKLERAGEHLKALHAEVTAYADGHPHRITSQLDSDGWYVVTFEIVRPMPDAISLIAGDAAHCLRSALDHIVYAVSESSKRSGCYWPISARKADYLEPRGKPGCERLSMREEGLGGVPEHIRAIIDETQPYHAGNRTDTHVFAVLNRLDNADKHRLVQPGIAVFKDPGMVEATHADTIERTLTTNWLALGQPLRMNEKTKILRWRADPPPSEDVSVKYHPKLGIVFGERGNFDQLVGAREIIYSLVTRIETAVL